MLKDASVTDYSVEVGAGRLVGELELALPGMQVGETRQVDVTFPADYEPRKVAGRTAQFDLYLKELKERVLPELDDAFAAQVSEHETLADAAGRHRGRGREGARPGPRGALPRRRDGRARPGGDRRRAAVDGRPARARPPRGSPRQLQRRGVSLDAYLRASGRTPQQAVDELRPEAEREVREELALRAYADRYDIRVSDEELEAFIRDEATQTKEDADRAVERLIGNPAGDELREDLRLRSALDHAVAHAKAITPDQAAAREKLWTPGQDAEKAESGRSALWLPPTAQ